MTNKRITLLVHDVRSAHNVGSILRMADGFGLEKIYLTGITPYPHSKDDKRLPHIGRKVGWQIHKTALGAEENVSWARAASPEPIIKDLAGKGYQIIALEQTDSAQSLVNYRYHQPVALLVGNELVGLPTRLLKKADVHLQIPMLGVKESHNAAAAAAVALYHLRFVA